MISEDYKHKLQVLSGMKTTDSLNEADLNRIKKKFPRWLLGTEDESYLNELIDKVTDLSESQQEIIINLVTAKVTDDEPVGHLFFHLKKGIEMFADEL